MPDESTQVSGIDALIPILPSVFAILLALLSPLLGSYCARQLITSVRQNAQSERSDGVVTSSNALSVDQYEYYSTFVIDLSQIPASGLLAVAGTGLGLATNIDATTGVVMITVAAIATFAAFLWVAMDDPSQYAGRRYPVYLTFGPLFAIVTNSICVAALLVFAGP